jgi:LacI family transcriptional regulator
VVDLARELGVSTATVSRALNGSAAVRPELADRIRRHAAQRGYVPNRHARALSAARSREFVAFVSPAVDTPAYSAVAAECARLFAAAGTQMLLVVTEDDPERELARLRELAGSRVAGLVISATAGMLPESRALLAGLPVVELHRASGIAAPGVFGDDEAVLADAVAHLAALGHTAIAYLGTPVELSHGRARLRGVRRGMAAAGLDPDAMAVRLAAPTREQGREAALAVLAERPTALVVGGGPLSVGAAEAVRRSGIRTPADLSLVVYGDPDWFALADPPLTTAALSYTELGRRAAALLVEALHARSTGGALPEPGPRLVRPHLVVAGSTGPAPLRKVPS